MAFNFGTMNWNDLRLFLAVATQGGLAAAANISDSTSPTLNRRMKSLEDTLGVILFERHHSGYSLTQHGRELLSRVQEMEAHSQSIQSWRSNLDQRPVVRITTGVWTSLFLARHLGSLTNNAADLRIELLSGSDFLSLSRREADIGIRNQIPEQQGLARKRIGPVGFAVFGSPEYCDLNKQSRTEIRYSHCDWIAPSVSGGTGTSSFWLRQKIGDTARLVCGTPQATLEAAASGNGLCILPCFIGSTDPRLVQCSDPISELTHVQWLVTHVEGKNLPHIRKVSRNLTKLFDSNRDLFLSR